MLKRSGSSLAAYMNINQMRFYIVRIRDWFDYKWCCFSGKILGAIAVRNSCDLKLPPFVPNRVLAQDHFSRSLGSSSGFEVSPALLLHVRQRSEANFKRSVRRITESGTIIWLSSGSLPTQRGSVMVYNISPDLQFGWHVTFLKKTRWQIEKVTSTSRAQVKALQDFGRDSFKDSGS